jgi:hypothetical protein
MGIREAEAAMAALESTKCSFDYDKAQYYQSRVQKYVEQKNEFFPQQPVLLDVSQGKTDLPVGLSDRIEKWMADHPDYSPFMRTFARHYLICLLDDECDAKMYGHLAECVVEGGDFYLETGMLFLRDAAAVSTVSAGS